jgi:hypothetical protein
MRFSVEAWAPEYGGTTDDEPFELDSESDLTVEMGPERWRPLRPEHRDPDVPIGFVDGVMRADARVWIQDGSGSELPGVCCSFAAGAVRCAATAEIVRVEVERALFTDATEVEPVLTRLSGAFHPRPSDGKRLDSNRVVIPHMRELERELVRELIDDVDLIVADGPMQQMKSSPNVVGYVKSHRATYLPDPVSGVIGQLEAGERTPLFLATTRWSRYSWYLRLPGPRAHGWAGVVRCEASAELEPAEAAALADRVTSAIPRFASTPHKDPRAPQNLFPIAGLERELHRRLGDPQLVWRDLRQVSATTSVGTR